MQYHARARENSFNRTRKMKRERQRDREREREREEREAEETHMVITKAKKITLKTRRLKHEEGCKRSRCEN